jgi:hypothetical protein
MFSRIESPTQTPKDALLQIKSGEIWGTVSRYGVYPTVRAYPKKLDGNRGIEFTTEIAPDRYSSTPNEARWYLGVTPNVLRRNFNSIEYACITASVSNFQL